MTTRKEKIESKVVEMTETNQIKLDVVRETISASVLTLLNKISENIHMPIQEVMDIIAAECIHVENLNTDLNLNLPMNSLRHNLWAYYSIFSRSKYSREDSTRLLGDDIIKQNLEDLKNTRARSTHLSLAEPFQTMTELFSKRYVIYAKECDIYFYVKYTEELPSVLEAPNEIILNTSKLKSIASFIYR